MAAAHLKVFAAAVLVFGGCTVEGSLVPAPIAPVAAYARAIPYNVLPYANSINVYTRNLYPAALLAPAPVAAALAPAPLPAAFAPAPAVVPAFGAAPVPAFSPAPYPAFAPAAVPAPIPAAALRVNSFLPTPFAAAPAPVPALVQAGPALAPIARSVYGLAPAGIAPSTAHGVAPGTTHSIAPGIAPGLPAPFVG